MKFKKLVIVLLLLVLSTFSCSGQTNVALAVSTPKYYTIYSDESKTDVLFLKGDDISTGDRYLSTDNKLYEIVSIDKKGKTGVAKFIKDEELPKFNVKSKNANSGAYASKNKLIGIYHTHNDECYYTPDGIDSVYGKGGIHDVGKALVQNLNKLNVDVIYREDLHLPHNSGAYTRSQVTAAALLNQGAQAIFDIHRDSTKRDYYLAKVDGKQISSIRMVVGSSSSNFEENKNFAYTIKSYADSAYPGLIKDIYFGKGNYNQQLSSKAMLFEMGCENIEKELVIRSTEYLAKVIDVVLYGSQGASELSLNDVSLTSDAGIQGVLSATNESVNSNETLVVVLSLIGAVLVTLTIVLVSSKKARYKVGRFFSEMFAGIFGKTKSE